MKVKDFLELMGPYADYASYRTGVPTEVILAQWGLETNWGESQAWKLGFNPAGIKPGSTWKGPIVGSYRKYGSITEGVQDYIRTMGLHYYDNVRNAGTIESAIIALHESPWATDPIYDRKLLSIVDGFKELFSGTSSGGWMDSGIKNNPAAPLTWKDKMEMALRDYQNRIQHFIENPPFEDIIDPGKIGTAIKEKGKDLAGEIFETDAILTPVFTFLMFAIVAIIGIYAIFNLFKGGETKNV